MLSQLRINMDLQACSVCTCSYTVKNSIIKSVEDTGISEPGDVVPVR